MILLIDNYDSFTYNLQRYLLRLGEQVVVLRNDAPQLLDGIGTGDPDGLRLACAPGLGGPNASQRCAIVLSPGPKRPCDAGCCLELVRRMSGKLPILGVCLGHQIICEALGGRVVRTQQPVHGRATPIELHHSLLFEGLVGEGGKAIVEFARYHSLVAEPTTLPKSLRVTAWADDGQIMAVEHQQHATYGVQFHPESILSLAGYRVLQNFLKIAGSDVGAPLPAGDLLDEQQLTNWQGPTQGAIGVGTEHAVVHPSAYGVD